MKFSLLSRKIHYYLSWFIFIPFAITVITGFLLMLRHHTDWIQPQKVNTGHSNIYLSFDDIVEAAKKAPGDIINNRDDIGKIVLRHKTGLIEVFAKDRMHLQLDGESGQILNVAPRYTGLFITLHEGVFFHKWVRDGIFLPAAFCLVLIWLTGSILLFTTWLRKRSRLK